MRKKRLPDIEILRVSACVDGANLLVLGDLSYAPRAGTSAFQWSQEALDLGFQWSPLHCPLTTTLWTSTSEENRLLDGLPGFIHDALPDGWGILVMDRAFAHMGIAKNTVTPLHRLAYLSDRTWGALSFEPQWKDGATQNQQINLAKISAESKKILDGDLTDVSNELRRASGGLQGARPKVFVALDHTNQHAVSGTDQLPSGHRHTIVKFAGHGETSSHVILESCYLDAARQCKIVTSPSCLLDVGDTQALCVDRFDRLQSQKVHVHSLAGMLHTSHSIPNTDWKAVARVLDDIQAPVEDKSQALRRALFNAMFCVRDDHTKNLAFQMNAHGKWSLAPAFDIAYSHGPGGYHTMMYDGHHGQYVETKDIQRLSAVFDVPFNEVQSWTAEMQDVRSQMFTTAKGLGVSQAILREVKTQCREIDRAMKKAPTKTLKR